MTRNKGSIAILLALLVVVITLSTFSWSFSQGPNNRNVSVDTRVNITQSLPQVLNVIINDGDQNITLTAGANTTIECNATVFDYNGGATITNVSAQFFDNTSSGLGQADDRNDHYSNASCTGGTADGFYRNFSCTFELAYFANHGFWACVITAIDDYPFNVSVGGNQSNGTNYTHVDGLLALNVTTLIDYGDLAVGDTSAPQQANITNLGNLDINVTVRGYGNTTGDGYAFICEQGTIDIENEKFNVLGGNDIAQYLDLSSTFQQIPNMTIPQQTNDAIPEINTSYWILYVPPNPFGVCNGTVVFQAETS